jgi:hypothetical protein
MFDREALEGDNPAHALMIAEPANRGSPIGRTSGATAMMNVEGKRLTYFGQRCHKKLVHA